MFILCRIFVNNSLIISLKTGVRKKNAIASGFGLQHQFGWLKIIIQLILQMNVTQRVLYMQVPVPITGKYYFYIT